MASAVASDNLTLGERIRLLRETGRHGRLSQDDLAEALGTTRQTVIGWEKHGRHPSPAYRERLAEFFGVPEETFRDGSEVPRLADLDARLSELEAERIADRLEELEAALEKLGPELRRLGSQALAEGRQGPTRTGQGGNGGGQQ